MIATRATRGHRGIGMNGLIARWYTTIRGKDVDEIRRGARQVAEHLPRGGDVLEIAPGPGFMAIELATLGDYRITGVDISESFVEIAAAKASEAGASIDFRHGDAAALPLPDESIDLTYCTAAFKNFSQPVKAMAEMHRVLRPGGTALIYDLRPDLTDADIGVLVRDMKLGTVNAALTRWTFKHMLTRRAHSRTALEEMARATPFGGCEVRESKFEYEVELRRRGRV
jgi:ubiquinone/menaquinone biosynthesis C-methylase UbiE